MSHSVGHEETHGGGTSEIKKVTIILSVLTIIELALGFWMIGMENKGLVLAIKGAIIILMLAKAFYIVSIFMHLGDEIRNLIMTIVVPLLLFVWFIIAFLWDGNSWKNLRNQYAPKTEVKHEKHTGGHEAGAEQHSGEHNAH